MSKGQTKKKKETGFIHIEVTPEGNVAVRSNINMPMELIGALEAAKEVKMRQIFPIKVQIPQILPGQIPLPPNGFKKR